MGRCSSGDHSLRGGCLCLLSRRRPGVSEQPPQQLPGSSTAGGANRGEDQLLEQTRGRDRRWLHAGRSAQMGCSGRQHGVHRHGCLATREPAFGHEHGEVLHAPNHRGVKGTEFLIDAVEQLQSEGLPVELVLLERVPNETVRQAMQEADILADQFVCPGYGLAAIEGMASGLPVLCNLEREDATRLFRLYSFLGECPIVSTLPETLVEKLRALVTDPSLRHALGQAGRTYTEKYHSTPQLSTCSARSTRKSCETKTSIS